MADILLDLLDTSVWVNVVIVIQLAMGATLVYLAIQYVRGLSSAGRWKLLKIALTILFLPLVFLWKFTTAGSDCGCCCDEDD